MVDSKYRVDRFIMLAAALALIAGCGTSEAPPSPRATPSPSPRPVTTTPAAKEVTPQRQPAAETAIAEAAWGSLHGRFVYDGEPPEQKLLNITRDAEFCEHHAPRDESLVVNPTNRGLANVVVALYVARGSGPPDIHESYDETATQEVTINNSNCRFDPHVVLLHTSQTLLIKNSDEIGHNTKITTFANPGINPITPAGESVSHKFTAAEPQPARVDCSIHPWMTAWVVVRDHPYFAVTDADGNFEIANLPAGEWTFQVWHEKANYISEVHRDGKPEKWTRGRPTFTIDSGGNDLGEILLQPDLFQ